MASGKFTRRLAAGTAVLAIVAATPALAETVRGRVLDGTRGVPLPGAEVRVAGGNLSTVAGRDGGFAIDGVAAGPVTIEVNSIGYETQTIEAVAAAEPVSVDVALTDIGPDIVVTGTLVAERKALQDKKSADNIIEALYANDVGKLPDQNVAEAVRRLPGISVANDQGEGRYVIIRGINPNLVNVQLNGLTLPAPEPDGRQVKLDDIPSALIQSVIVTKTLTPDQEANAIGGTVDIRTLSAFDRNKPLFVDARAAYGYAHLNKGHPYEGDVQIGAVGGPDDQFGIVLSGNYSERPIESENFQGSTNWRPVNGRIVPDQYGLRDYNLTRKRIGLVGNFDWRPSDDVKVFVRGTYSKFDDDEARDQFIIDNQQTAATPAATTFRNQTATTGTFNGRGSYRIRRRIEKDNTKSLQAGGTFAFGTATLDVAGGYTRAEKRDPLRSEYNFRTGGTALAVNYDVSDTPYLFNVTNPLPTSSYGFQSVNYDQRIAVEKLWQGRADLIVPIPFGGDSSVKFGGKYIDRHKTNDRAYQTYGIAIGRTFNAAPVSVVRDTDFYDGRYVFGPRIDYDIAQAYLAANPGTIALNVGSSRANSLANDYDVRERIAAGYAMATLKFGGFTIIPGVRVEHTSDRSSAKLITATSPLNQGYNAFGRKDYTDVFPGVNVKFDVTRKLVLRAAATTAVGRPNYPDLSPYVAVDATASPVAVTRGDPNLSPQKSLNLDAGVEYYLPGQGLVSVAAFYKRIDDPIYTQTILTANGVFAGQTIASALVTTPVNAGSAIVRGIEANVQTRFTFLPSPLDGFGVAANYAHISGHGDGLPSRAGKVPLFLQSKDVASAQIFYEKYNIALRAAYSYRSPYLDTLGTNAATDQYTDENGQLDVNASYQVTPQLTFFANATNLTDAPWRRYIGTKNQLVERERYDYTIRWGAQVHF